MGKKKKKYRIREVALNVGKTLFYSLGDFGTLLIREIGIPCAGGDS